MKISVIGYSGSGKSTLAAALGRRYGAEVLHLDRVKFGPGWADRPREVMLREVEEFLGTRQDWVIDGNYSDLLHDRRMAESDRIYFLDFGRWTCLGRALRRWWRNRGQTRPSMAEGCVEKIDAEFFWWLVWSGRTPARRARFTRVVRRWGDKVTVVKNQRALTCLYQREGLV